MDRPTGGSPECQSFWITCDWRQNIRLGTGTPDAHIGNALIPQNLLNTFELIAIFLQQSADTAKQGHIFGPIMPSTPCPLERT